MKKILHYTLLIILSIGLFACSDDDKTGPIIDDNQAKASDQVSHVFIKNENEAEVFAFFYNDKNVVEKMVFNSTDSKNDENNSVNTYLYTYATDSKLTQFTVSEVYPNRTDGSSDSYEIVTFTYNDNIITVTKNETDKNGTITSIAPIIETITLDDEGLIINLKDALEEIDFECKYNANRNLSELIQSPTYKDTYPVYDSNPSFLKNTGLPKWYWIYLNDGLEEFSSENNALKVIDGEGDVTKYTIEYNKINYPKLITTSDFKVTFMIKYRGEE